MKTTRLLAILLCLTITSCDSGGGGGGGDGGKSVTVAVALGDSITRGLGVPESYVGPLSRSIGKPVINAGSDGRTTASGVNAVASLIARHNPSHLVILLGTNDAIKGLSESGATANLQSMIDQANARGVKVVIGTLPPITRNEVEGTRARHLSAAIRQLKGAKVADLEKEFGDGEGLFVDGVHPTTDGQNIIAAAFAEKL